MRQKVAAVIFTAVFLLADKGCASEPGQKPSPTAQQEMNKRCSGLITHVADGKNLGVIITYKSRDCQDDVKKELDSDTWLNTDCSRGKYMPDCLEPSDGPPGMRLPSDAPIP